MSTLSKIPNRVLRFILEFLWEVEDNYYLTTSKVSRYFYLKLQCFIGSLEEEMYRRNMAYRLRRRIYDLEKKL
jgi:hypothetical protein